MTSPDWSPAITDPDMRYDLDGYDPETETEADGGHDEDEDDDEVTSSIFNRRRFLQVMVAGSAAAAGYGVVSAGREQLTASGLPGYAEAPSTSVDGPTVAQPSTQVGVTTRANEVSNGGQLLAGAVENRVLVVVEMEGGNDGLSTVIPAGAGTYYDMRPNIAVPEEEVLALDAEVGLNPNLARLHARGIAVVEGVGPVDGVLSHFEMVQRWDQGDVSGANDIKSGFLARLADTVDDGSPLVGLSVGGATPRFANSTASTLAIDDLGALSYLASGEDIGSRLRAYHNGLVTFSVDELSMLGMVGSSWAQLLLLGATINEQTQRENDENNPMFTDGGNLGRQLAVAADLIAADVGVKIVHARIGGFDTHENQLNRHNDLMGQLDASIDGFLQQIALDGVSDRVLVATTSEFGRRIAENQQGTDHGSGSVMLLAGPVPPGRYGVSPLVSSPDDNGNLPVEVPFDNYLATLAEGWLGIEAGSVLPNDPETLPIII